LSARTCRTNSCCQKLGSREKLPSCCRLSVAAAAAAAVKIILFIENGEIGLFPSAKEFL